MAARRSHREVVIRAEDYPGLGADAARSINETVRPEGRAAVAAKVAATLPPSEVQKRKFADIMATAQQRACSRR